METKNAFNGNVIDLEASGLSPDGYPIEVGVVLGSGESFDALIKPLPHWQDWDEYAQEIHGITREQLEREGMHPRAVCEKLNALCYGKTLYSDCWVYDHRWLHKLFGDLGMHMTFRCSAIEYLLSEEQLSRWQHNKNAFVHATGIRPHRALNDAVIISETLERECILQTPSHLVGGRDTTTAVAV